MSTILIVDDNKKNLQVLGNILHEKNYKVAMALDGPSALKLVPKINPDLIVLDIMMPGMDGFEVCSQLKASVETKKIPIIFLTAKIDLEDIVKGFRVGGSDYVTKPFKKEELLARIETHIELIENRKQIEQQNQQLLALNALKDKIFAVVASDIKIALDSFIEVPKLIIDPRLKLSTHEIEAIMLDLQTKAGNTYLLLEDLLWWSRAQQKLIQPKIGWVNVQQIFLSIHDYYKDQLNAKNIKLTIEADNSSVIIADEKLTLIAMKKLVHNALKFSNNNSKIWLNYHRNDQISYIDIIDCGIGIPTNIIEKFKNPYSYHTEFGTNNEKGSGIGLKLVFELLALMNAKIDFKSKPGEGTTVRLSFQNEPVNI